MDSLRQTERTKMDFYGQQQQQQQQPMSLVTISRGQLRSPETPRPSRLAQGGLVDGDLLTLRILEASERKMLMIKELLSPEEFRSVASSFYTADLDRTQAGAAGQSRPRIGAGFEASSVSALTDGQNQSTRSLIESSPTADKMKRVRFSRSETNLTIAQSNSNDIKRDLDKRKKAVEFFLGTETSKREEMKMPSFESRFGQYLQSDEERERVLGVHLGGGSLGHLFALIWGVIRWVGDCLSLTAARTDEPRDKVDRAELEFIERHRAFNWAPFTRERNMRAVAKRLRADEQLAKLARASRPHLRGPPGGQQVAIGRDKQEMITLISRKGCRNRVKLKLIDLEQNRWIAMRSFGPRSLPRPNSGLALADHSSVDRLARAGERLFEQYAKPNGPLGESRPSGAISRVDIRFERISIDEHKLIRPEVRLAKSLIAVYDQYEQLLALVERASFRVSQLVSEHYSNEATTMQSLGLKWLQRLLSLLQLKCNLLTRLNMKQLKLGEIWADIKLVRSSKSYKLTSLELEAATREGVAGARDLLGQRASQTLMAGPHTMSLMNDLGNLRGVAEQVEVLRSFIDIEQRLVDELGALKRLQLKRVIRPAERSNISAEDLEASNELAHWFDSLSFSVAVRADDSSGRFTIESRQQKTPTQMDDLHRFDVASSGRAAPRNCLTLARPISDARSAKLELDVQIEQVSEGSGGSLGRILSRRRLVKRAKFEAPIRSDVDLLVANDGATSRVDHYEIKLDLAPAAAIDDEDEDKVDSSDQSNSIVSIEFSVMQALDIECGLDIKELSRKLLVDRLHAVLFVGGNSRRLDTASKSAQLVNQIGPTCLLTVMSELGLLERPRATPITNYCLLDAFTPHFRPSATCNFLANFRPASLRLALLSRRWASRVLSSSDSEPMDQVRGMVYLSEHENMRKLLANETQLGVADSGLIHEQLKSRLKRSSSQGDQQVDVARGIEQNRAAALEYIQRLDSLIGQLLETQWRNKQPDLSGVAQPDQGSGRPIGGHTREQLLIEPTIRWRRPKLAISVDVLLLVRSLVPKPTARRPLMPRRNRPARQEEAGGLATSSRWAQLVRRTQSAEAPGWLGESLAAANHLRLIVTIQRASNVPYRLVSAPAASFAANQQTGSSPQTALLYPVGSPALARSNSPLFSPSPMMMLSGGGASSPLLNAASQTPSFQRQQQQQQQASLMLMPATTYVEAIFQRKQLASSLAQGKNPAWNETLFFEVANDGSNRDENLPEQMRQLHLADECLQLNLYDCRSFVQEGDGPPVETCDLVGPTSGQLSLGAASGGANRLLVARRRIERHLIGSLSVPMSALLTTSGRVEGSFSLSQPLLLDNYQHEQMDSMAAQAGAIQQQRLAADQAGGLDEIEGATSKRSTGTHLSVFITLDPPVSLPLGVQLLAAGSHERRDQFELAQLWERLLLRVTPREASRSVAQNGHEKQPYGRAGQTYARSQPHIRALVLRDDARYCLISRHLRPLSPPRDLVSTKQPESAKLEPNNELQDEEDESHLLRLLNDDQPDEADDRMRRVARFVSLLSPLKYGLFRIRPLASSLWFDSSQLLSDHLGGPEEKAVLLCNYFLHLGKCSGLALGESLASGRCVYVLVWPDRMRPGRPQSASDIAAGSDPVHAGNFLERLPILIQTRSCHLWDPNSGCRHKLADLDWHHDNSRSGSLPLVSIGSIVTPENVYANLQSAPVGRLDLDLRQRSRWFPLFHEGVRSGTSEDEQAVKRNCALIRRESRRIMQTNGRRKRLAQLEQLARAIGRPPLGQQAASPLVDGARGLGEKVYESYTASQCQQLRDKLERAIKSNLLTWRPTRPTYFNRTLSRIIADKLASFERGLLAGNGNGKHHEMALDDPDWWRAELAELLRLETSAMANLGAVGFSQPERRLISWPANLAYTSMQPIIEGLFASGVHNADLLLEGGPSSSGLEAGGQSSSAQFLVSVHVEAYPARVMSVWLFVGVLVTVK